MTDSPQTPRRPYRPPIGIPTPKEKSTGGAIVSVAIHLAILLMLLGPFWMSVVLDPNNKGAGGPGPAGGGGGGNNGTGGLVTERLRFVQTTPPPVPVTTPVPVVALRAVPLLEVAGRGA